MAGRKRTPATAPVQPTAIPERGEHKITLAGVTYRLRPSHAALRAIENRLDRSQMRLISLGNTGDLLIDQIGVIAAELIKAGAADELTARVSAERIGELIQEEGVPPIVGRLTLCLLDAATGGRTASGEAKAATA